MMHLPRAGHPLLRYRGQCGFSVVANATMKVPFSSPVMQLEFNLAADDSSNFHAALNKLSAACIDQTVHRRVSAAQLQTPLEGGEHTAANVIYFKSQTSHFFQHGRHLDMLEQNPAFVLLKRYMSGAIAEYLRLAGCSESKREVFMR